MDNRALCFFHSADLDGHCSGAIVKHEMGDDVVLRGINYGDTFPWDEVKDREVIMVDFSLQPFSDMVRLHKLSSNFVWIDHHKSAIDEYSEYNADGLPWDGLREIGKGACELCWEYFYPTWGDYVPRAVKLLSLYDVWRHDEDEDALPFQFGMRVRDTYPTHDQAEGIWTTLLSPVGSSTINQVLREGKTILKYQEQQNEAYARSASFVTILGGFRCIVINRMITNSQIFDSVWDEDKYDAMVTFGWRKGKWTFSMYSTSEDIDVSVFCKSMGGGGHKNASGFQLDELPKGFLK